MVFDNGSLRPAAALQLRAIADTLQRALGRGVVAASVLHSDKIAAGDLGGERAVLVEQVARAFWQRHPEGEVLLVPAFFGPSRAITHYLPERLKALVTNEFSGASWRMGECLVDCEDAGDPAAADANDLVVDALAQEARRVIGANGLSRNAKVLLVDHGSPARAVTAVREFLGARLRELLRGEVACVGTASMERRGGGRYAFNEPLLAGALRAAPFDSGDVVVLLQFLARGRHAGEAGDVETICDAARSERGELRVWLSDTVGASAQIAEVLRRRFLDLMNK